jgi:2-hydroxy-3-keto-5-methylthiopentenyl-1-phosphate phosphatase
MNQKIKKVFEKMDPELQEAIKFLINDIQVKREIKKINKK